MLAYIIDSILLVGYFVMLYVSVSHLCWIARWRTSNFRAMARVQNPSELLAYLADKLRTHVRQQALTVGMIVAIIWLKVPACFASFPRESAVAEVCRLLFGGAGTSGPLQLGLCGMYWGMSFILSSLIAINARHQMQAIWSLRKDLPVDMPGYRVEQRSAFSAANSNDNRSKHRALIAFIILLFIGPAAGIVFFFFWGLDMPLRLLGMMITAGLSLIVSAGLLLAGSKGATEGRKHRSTLRVLLTLGVLITGLALVYFVKFIWR